jgi:hypothetical protein
MNCPTIDKLSQYVDNLLSDVETIQVYDHIKSCKDCKRVVEAFEAEEQFLIETLQTPTLATDFEDMVLNQLEPYKKKETRKKTPSWKRMLVSAAVVVMAFGVTTAFNPSFAEWVGGLFSTERVDEGLRIASDEGFVTRVDLEAADKGLIFKVEDVIADTSRVALSYQVLNESGKTQDSYLDFGENKNEIYAIDEKGKRIEIHSMGWSDSDDYGLIELSLRELDGIKGLTLKFHLTELDGVEGNWDLEVPVDLTESLKSTKKMVLEDKEANYHGVSLLMKEVRFAPSSNELLYETGFTDEERTKIEKQIKGLEKSFGEEIVHTFTGYGTAIQYHLENEDAKPIYYHNAFLEGKGHPSDIGLIQGTGQDLAQLGKVAWNESFVPQKQNQNLTFVLDGVIKTVPTDFSIKVKPKELKGHPVTFEYEGNHVTIKAVDIKSEYSLRKSIIPIERETIFTIEMEGGKDALASELGEWVITDNNGNSYLTYSSGSILDEKDENGRYKTTTELRSYDLEEVPEEFTLHLISVTRYEEIDEKWEVPLY